MGTECFKNERHQGVCGGVPSESRSTFGMGRCSDVVSLGPGLGLGFRLGCLQNCLKHKSQATFVGVCFRTGSPLSVPLSQGSQTQFQHRIGGFPDTTHNYQTPAGCLRIQFCYDIVRLETASDPQVRGLVLRDCPPPTSEASSGPRLLPVLLTSQLRIGAFNHLLLG